MRGPLSERRLLDLPAGSIGVREAGSGEPVLFIPGLVANGLAWRNVVPHLAAQARCIAPDWPLGSHSPALPNADLTLPGLAHLVVQLLDALNLRQVTLVGNGYGGDIAQVVAAEYPGRVSRLVLIAPNAFDSDPWTTRALVWLSRPPGAGAVQSVLMRSRLVQRLPFTYGFATKRPIPEAIMASYLASIYSDAAVRHDFHRFLRGLSPRYLARASPALATFDRPALVISPAEDRVFPRDGAQLLADTLPQGRLATIADSYAWAPEDQPAELARMLLTFLNERR
ncbi:alpha/beta fold hydrolase [Actinocorallia lasiicapitis]